MIVIETLVVVGKPYDSSEHPAASVLLNEILGSNDCAGLNGAERWPLEAALIHNTGWVSPRLIPGSPQSLSNFFQIGSIMAYAIRPALCKQNPREHDWVLLGLGVRPEHVHLRLKFFYESNLGSDSHNEGERLFSVQRQFAFPRRKDVFETGPSNAGDWQGASPSITALPRLRSEQSAYWKQRERNVGLKSGSVGLRQNSLTLSNQGVRDGLRREICHGRISRTCRSNLSATASE
jgi:hypothetical protein